MRKTSAALACLGVTLLVAAAALAAPEAKGSLDGKTFVGEVGEKGKKEEKDTLHFADGRFRSAACDAYGFADAPYTAALASDGSVTWTAETVQLEGRQDLVDGKSERRQTRGNLRLGETGTGPDRLLDKGDGAEVRREANATELRGTDAPHPNPLPPGRARGKPRRGYVVNSGTSARRVSSLPTEGREEAHAAGAEAQRSEAEATCEATHP